LIKHFFEWANQPTTLADFIGLAFVTAVVTMAVCLSLLIVFDVLN
jgi:hypothetical protein